MQKNEQLKAEAESVICSSNLTGQQKNYQLKLIRKVYWEKRTKLERKASQVENEYQRALWKFRESCLKTLLPNCDNMSASENKILMAKIYEIAGVNE